MNEDASIAAAKEIMLHFAKISGLTGSGKPAKRYLWTDAFAVCNFLELFRQTQDDNWRELALRLVDQVHQVLGRHRRDSARTGWISGLSEEEGKLHPTRAGLRIGKPLNERQPDDFPDERLEWDRDGQYYHYLTKWMHALHRVSRVTGNVSYLGWAMELAKGAHAAFCYDSPEGGKRLYWKMSIDLKRPVAKAMGQHDPLDGLVTYSELRAAARALPEPALPSLDLEIAELAEMCQGREWATDDTLGIGGLLSDASRIAQLMAEGELQGTNHLQEVLDAARVGLAAVTEENELVLSGRFRLAFRELGLSTGLQAAKGLPALLDEHPAPFAGTAASLRDRLQVISQYMPLKDRIEAFWLDPVNQETATWQDHKEINMVMLATSLAPGQFLSATGS